jgi:hypothetical protein
LPSKQGANLRSAAKWLITLTHAVEATLPDAKFF